MRIRSAPPDVTVDALEQVVPAALREELEILHALSWRAHDSGNAVAAERHCRTALQHHPHSIELQEQLAVFIVHVESRAKQANQPISTSRLEDAVKSMTAGMAQNRGPRDAARLRYTRAEAYDLLGRTEEAETDFRGATEINKDEPEVVRRFALFLARHERDDAAIEALRQADKARIDVNNRLLLASLLGERNRPSDRESAAALLRETIPLITTAEPEMRAAVVATLTQLLGCLKRQDDALKLLDGLDEGLLTTPAAKAIRSAILLRVGRKEEARSCALEGLKALGADTQEADRIRVAEALGFVGEKQEALDLWKSVLKPDRADPFVCTALQCAKECGDDQFILSFCKQLRAAGVRDAFTMELEVVTQEKYGMFDQAIAVMQTFLSSPPDEDLARVFRVRLSLLGIRLGRQELVETDVAKLPTVETAPAKIGAAVAYILRNGPFPEQGVNYAYELVRRHYTDATARQAYVGTIGFGDERNYLFPEPATITPGCAVKYKADDSGEEKWVIVEDGTNPQPEREEIGPSHLWAKEMAGKVVREQFYLRRDPIQSRTATIQAICSKYIYRKFEILDTWEERFPDQFFARKYTFPTLEDGSPDISLILKAIDLKEQQTEQMHALYRENPISAATFARLADAGLLEALSHLASEGTLPIRCCGGTMEELERAEAALADAGTLVLDSSAIATLFFSGQYEHLQRLAAKCIICESALDEYLELRRKFANPSQGFAGKFKGKYLFREDDPEERQRQEQRLLTFLAKIRSLVTMRSGENLAGVSPERREEMIGLFGQPTAEAIAEAAATGAVIWTDDIAVAEVARERAAVAKRVWTQMVFKYTAPRDAYVNLTLFLMQWRYFFTRVEPDVVLAACRIASWDPDAPSLRRVVEWLSAPELNYLGAGQVCALSLPLVWKHGHEIGQKENVTRALMRAILGRDGGRQIVISIANNLNAIFEGDNIARSQCEFIIRGVLSEEMKTGNDESRAAWAQAIRRLQKKWHSSDNLLPVQPGPQSGRADRGSDLTPKQRADRRKADQKHNKRVVKKKGKRNGSR